MLNAFLKGNASGVNIMKILIRMILYDLDINECDSPEDNECDVMTERCVNIKGGYQCPCKSGYQMNYRSGKCEGMV